LLPNQRSNFRRARFTTLGLQLHLDASLPATVIRDGSNFVSAWNDKSGKARNMAQGTQANKPLFLATGLGGLGALQFDGTDDFMTFSDQTLSYIASKSFTVFYVASKPANNNTWVFGGTNTGTRTNLYAGNLTANTHRVGFYNDDQGSIVTAAASGTTEIYTIVYDSSNNQRTIRRNRVEVSRAVTGGSVSSMTGQAIGRYISSYGNFKIGEFLIYDRALQFAEQETVEKDLISKWSIV
jgi:hypothetical protein